MPCFPPVSPQQCSSFLRCPEEPPLGNTRPSWRSLSAPECSRRWFQKGRTKKPELKNVKKVLMFRGVGQPTGREDTLNFDNLAMKSNSRRFPSRVVGASCKALTPHNLRVGIMATPQSASPWWQWRCWLLVVPGCLHCLTTCCSRQPAQETPFQKDVDGKPCSASDSASGLSQVALPHLEREIMLTYLIL